MQRITVLSVDDHAIVRRGLRALLEAEDDFEVIGEAATGQEALSEAARLKPDLVLMDITLPDMNGLEAMVRIKEASPQTKVVILTVHEDEEYFFRAIHAGAAGYVIKGGGAENILTALRAAQEGGVVLWPSLAMRLVRDTLRGGEDSLAKTLAPRELEILRLVADGLGNKEIASRLGISITTVKTHRARVMEKLGLHTVAELIRYAIRKGIVRP